MTEDSAASLWEDWEELTELEIEECFEGLDDWKGVICGECGASFPTVKALKRHHKDHKVPTNTSEISEDAVIAILQRACLNCKIYFQCAPSFEELDMTKAVPLVKQLHTEYCKLGVDSFYQHYSNICHQANKLVGVSQMPAAALLLKIFDSVVCGQEQEPISKIGGVNSKECGKLIYCVITCQCSQMYFRYT